MIIDNKLSTPNITPRCGFVGPLKTGKAGEVRPVVFHEKCRVVGQDLKTSKINGCEYDFPLHVVSIAFRGTKSFKDQGRDIFISRGPFSPHFCSSSYLLFIHWYRWIP